MSQQEAIARLSSYHAKTARLESTLALLQWDHRTSLPFRGHTSRSEVIGEISRLVFERVVSQELGDCLAAVQEEKEALSEEQRAGVRAIRAHRAQLLAIPEDLYHRFTVTRSVSESAWDTARKRGEYALFQPHLETMIGFAREFAACYGRGGNPYDALLQQYEPDMSTAVLESLVNDLKDRLVPSIHQLPAPSPIRDDPFTGPFPVEAQAALARDLLTSCGLDFEAACLGTTQHPFSLYIGPGDVRIAVRYDEHNLRTGLFTSLHEGGHALYVQGLPPGMMWLGIDNEGVSHGIHESQSRFWENLVGRSRPFWQYLGPVLAERFPRFRARSVADLYRGVNPLNKTPVRLQADELTYTLHIILRFEIECELFNGTLDVSELPARWNEASREYLGVEPANDAEGPLQDIHWASGIFGGFPCYMLGNLYGAQLRDAMRTALPTMDEQVADGRFESVLAWLRKNIHEKGKCLTPQELLVQATGRSLSATPFADYITEKYAALYGG